MAEVYKPFLIAVGQAGAYSDNMNYEPVFDTLDSYGLWIKHVPLSLFPKIKDVVSQKWQDEQGDDVWLPPTGIMSESYDLSIDFVYYWNDGMAMQRIRDFIERIKGKWLKIYDTYSNTGRQGVFLQEFDANPTYQRRGEHDTVILKVKFKVNDPSTDVKL